MSLPAGTALYGGAYRVTRTLGRGGFGITYEGVDERLQCPVAIKEFFPLGCVRRGSDVHPADELTRRTFQEARSRFLQEGRTLARFNHRGIVRVIAAFEENATTYIVMEYLEGEDLESRLARTGGTLDPAETLDYARQACRALRVVHNGGTLHRDIKPSNLMCAEDGRLVLIDFGAARDYVAGLTHSETVIVTAGYAPFEQYSLHVARGPYTDLYALAAVMYRCVTGRTPPPATDRAQGLEMEDAEKIVPALPPQLSEAIRRGMEMEIDSRPQTVDAFLEILDAPPPPPTVAPPQQEPAAVPSPQPIALPAPVASSRDWQRRHRVWVGRKRRGFPAFLIALLVLLAGGGAWLALDPSPWQATRDNVTVGKVDVASIPDGAAVSVDGRRVGVAPLTVSHAMAGDITLEVAMDGYETWKGTLPMRDAVHLKKITVRLMRETSQGKDGSGR